MISSNISGDNYLVSFYCCKGYYVELRKVHKSFVQDCAFNYFSLLQESI